MTAVRGATATVQRVWVIGGTGFVVTATPGDVRKVQVLDRDFRQVSAENFKAVGVRLFVRR